MASRLLAELANEDPSFLPLHQKNLAYALRALYKDHGTEASVELANKSKLWGIAMLLRTFVASPYFEQYSGHAEKLANAIRSLQKADGSFHAWYKAPNYKYDEDYLLTFYSGEGILALLEYYLKTKNIKRRDIALLSQDYYLQAYVEHIEENYYPAYVPRHTISLYHAYQITQEKKYADAIFLLNNKLIDEMLHTDTTTPHYLWRFYNPQFPQYGSPHSASDGVFLEWLVYAYRLAKELGDTSHITKYKDAILLAAHNLMRLQYGKKAPTTLAWAIRISHKNPDIRIDTTQHMIDAFHVLLATDIVTQ